ncbi:MAG: hypothetical protein H0W30_04530 [Gemmatimonadaceae bacterium]|nr:hypothetical protein [Gemmatimonadaceae bacterium]MBA3557848.1 hypothetical protein [Gemmatimonadaceae bacterium]
MKTPSVPHKNPLENITLWIPQFPAVKDRGEKSLDGLEGSTKLIALQQLRAATLLDDLQSTPASFAKIAWLTHWTRVFEALNATRAALDAEVGLACGILARICMEQALQIQVILDPVVTTIGENSKASTRVQLSSAAKDRYWHEAVDRLNAYAAWCLYSDADYYRFLCDKNRLNDVWEEDSRRAILRDPTAKRMHELFYGPIEILSDAEVALDRKKHEKGIREGLTRITSWLESSAIADWRLRIKTCTEKARPRSITFFELFNETEQTIRKRLTGQRLGFAYQSYQRGSLLVHGTTIEHVLGFSQDTLLPRIGDAFSDTTIDAADVADWCSHILLGLGLLKGRVFQLLDVNP